IGAPGDKSDRYTVPAAAKIVCDARFARLVQEVAIDHAEREADGCDENQLGQAPPHAVSHGRLVFRSLRRRLGLQASGSQVAPLVSTLTSSAPGCDSLEHDQRSPQAHAALGLMRGAEIGFAIECEARKPPNLFAGGHYTDC